MEDLSQKSNAAKEKATEILERFKRYRNEDIELLAENWTLLEKRNLLKLNENLYKNKREVMSFLAEHNFAAELVKFHEQSVAISYEPDGFKRPPDFLIKVDNTECWIQMKRLSLSERENRQEKIIKKIEESFENIEIGKFWGIRLSDSFNEDDIQGLVDFITTVVGVKKEIEDGEYCYKVRRQDSQYTFGCSEEDLEETLATISIWQPQKSNLKNLTRGYGGDLGTVLIDERPQIKGSLEKAAGAFTWDVSEEKINVIAMDAGFYEDIDIGMVVYGEELYFANFKKWKRGDDGFFDDNEFSSKVAAVIALRRETEGLISGYRKHIFINERYKGMIEKIKSFIPYKEKRDRIIHYNDRLDEGFDVERIDIGPSAP